MTKALQDMKRIVVYHQRQAVILYTLCKLSGKSVEEIKDAHSHLPMSLQDLLDYYAHRGCLPKLP